MGIDYFSHFFRKLILDLVSKITDNKTAVFDIILLQILFQIIFIIKQEVIYVEIFCL